MCKARRVVVVMAGAALALSLLFPPWVCWVSRPSVSFRGIERGGRLVETQCYSFILAGPQAGDWPAVPEGTVAQPWSWGAHIDTARLLAQLGAIAVAGCLAFAAVGWAQASSSSGRKPRRAPEGEAEPKKFAIPPEDLEVGGSAWPRKRPL